MAWCNVCAAQTHMQLYAHKVFRDAYDHAACQQCDMHVVHDMLWNVHTGSTRCHLGVSGEDFGLLGTFARPFLGYVEAVCGPPWEVLGGTWAHPGVEG